MMDEEMSTMNGVKCSMDSEFVEVLFARSSVEAREFLGMLQQHNIPARMESSATPQRESGVAVLVPSDRLIEASEFLAAAAQLEEEESDTDDDVDDFDDDYDDVDDDDFDDDDDDDDECDDDDDDDDGFEEEEVEEV